MPVSLKRLRETNAAVLLHLCEVCGADAPFGVGVHMRLAIKKLEEKNVAGAKYLLGEWYCGEHVPGAGAT